MTYLLDSDYKNISKFFYRISNYTGDFRESVLSAVSSVFGYDRATFWIADAKDMLVDPRYNNVDSSIINSYADKYYQYDPFDYNNLKHHLKKKMVLSLEDVIDTNEYYDRNIYYKDILSQFCYNQKIVIFLKDEGKYLGGMSFLRTRNEKPFTKKDKALLEIIGNYVTCCFKKEIVLSATNDENRILHDFIKIGGSGIVVLDYNGNVEYINDFGKVYLKDIYEDTNFQLKQVIEHIFHSNGYAVDRYIKEQKEPIFMVKFSGYNIQAGIKNCGGKLRYYIIISKINDLDFANNLDDREFYNRIHLDDKKLKLLTKKELEIVDFVCKGYGNEEIARELFISLPTVKTHVSNIFKKLNVVNRVSLILELMKH